MFKKLFLTLIFLLPSISLGASYTITAGQVDSDGNPWVLNSTEDFSVSGVGGDILMMYRPNQTASAGIVDGTTDFATSMNTPHTDGLWYALKTPDITACNSGLPDLSYCQSQSSYDPAELTRVCYGSVDCGDGIPPDPEGEGGLSLDVAPSYLDWISIYSVIIFLLSIPLFSLVLSPFK